MVSACSFSFLDGPVAIRTDTHDPGACLLVGFGGVLIADPTWGLALLGTDPGSTEPPNSHRFGVVWPRGYSARREHGTILLVDSDGKVVAREGDTVVMGNPPANDVVHPCPPIEVDS